MSCVYTTQGNLLCGDSPNKSNDALVQTQFRGGCAKSPSASNANKEHFTGIASTFRAALGSGLENFAAVPSSNKGSVSVTMDLEGTYGLPWAPY